MNRALGFGYFQDHILSRLPFIKDKHIPENRIKLLQIIEKRQAPDVEFDDIEKLVAQDADACLSYKFLRLLNSAAIGLSNRINSVR